MSIFSAKMIERFVVPNLDRGTDRSVDDKYLTKVLILNGAGDTETISASDIYNQDKYTKDEIRILENAVHRSAWHSPGKFNDHELLPIENDLSQIHGRIVRYLRRFVWFSDDNAYDLVANWVISSYFREVFRYAPVLIFDGVTVSGKSTTLKTLNLIVYRGQYVTNYSAAALSRQIETDNVTLLLDELMGTMQSDRGMEVCELIKAAFEKGNLLIRADPKSQRVYKNHVHTHIALTVKAEGLPEDVYNRGIRIGMIGMPDDLELGDIDSIHEDEELLDDISPYRIRTELYALRWAFLGGSKTFGLNWEEPAAQTRRHLRDRIDSGEWKGQWYYAFVNGMKGAPQIRGRARNIASTLYTTSLLTGSERPTIELIADSVKANREIIIDTPEAITFMAMVDAVFSRRKELGVDKLSPVITSADFDHIVENVSTTDVANCYNAILKDQGNAGRDEVPTKTITAKILSLGFSYERGKQNKSYFKPQHRDFKPFFMQYLRMWAPEWTDSFDLSEEVNKTK